MSDTFETYIANDRARIDKERKALLAKRGEIDTKLAGLDTELAAIEAYEAVKSGKAPAATRGPGASGTGRRTGQREAVLAVVKRHPGGITAGDVLRDMNAQSDADKTSVRNALSALKRANSVALKDGKYLPA
jgi:hypothetical protein